MKKFVTAIIAFTLAACAYLLFSSMARASGAAADQGAELQQSLHQIKNFKFVSDSFASSGMLELSQYQHIKAYGFKHVINLIPGMQLREKRHVESLGMSYEQIPVDWKNPTLNDFKKFVELMKSYGDDKVYVHCQLNWRASAFVYLYRVTQLGVDNADAEKDMLTIWRPHDGWDLYIEKVLKANQS